MTVLLEAEFPRTLDSIAARIRAAIRPGEHAQAWLFEGEAARRAAEAQLATEGIPARLSSRYSIAIPPSSRNR